MITLIIGGASSGKSEIAENYCMKSYGKKAYIATMIPFGTQAKMRIERHVNLRKGKGFETIEKYTNLGEIAEKLSTYDTLLVECMTNLVANEIYQTPETLRRKNEIAKSIFDDIIDIHLRCTDLIIVTCNVFSDGIEYSKETFYYLKQLGMLNQMLAEKADCVVDVFYGIPTVIKGELYDIA